MLYNIGFNWPDWNRIIIVKRWIVNSLIWYCVVRTIITRLLWHHYCKPIVSSQSYHEMLEPHQPSVCSLSSVGCRPRHQIFATFTFYKATTERLKPVKNKVLFDNFGDGQNFRSQLPGCLWRETFSENILEVSNMTRL